MYQLRCLRARVPKRCDFSRRGDLPDRSTQVHRVRRAFRRAAMPQGLSSRLHPTGSGFSGNARTAVRKISAADGARVVSRTSVLSPKFAAQQMPRIGAIHCREYSPGVQPGCGSRRVWCRFRHFCYSRAGGRGWRFGYESRTQDTRDWFQCGTSPNWQATPDVGIPYLCDKCGLGPLTRWAVVTGTLALAERANRSAAASARLVGLVIHEVLLLKIAGGAIGVQPVAQTATAGDQCSI